MNTRPEHDSTVNKTVWSRFRRPSFSRRLLLWGFLLPLALDVRKMGESSGSSFQVFLVGLAVISGFVYILLESQSHKLYRGKARLFPVRCFWWSFLLSTPLPVIIWSVDVQHYLKVLLPFLLFGFGLNVMSAVQRRRVDPLMLLDILAWCAIISTIWRVLYAVPIVGLSVANLRWEVLSPANPFAIGYGVVGLYVGRRPKLAAFALVTAGAAVTVSITRSYLITAAFVAVTLYLVDSRRRSSFKAFLTSTKLLWTAAPLIAAAIIAVLIARPDVIQNWSLRLFQNSADGGLDITLITRVAEYVGQYEALTRNATTMLIGNGVGADYIRNAGLLELLSFEAETEQWFAGHSTWVYSFFSSGLILGAIVPFILLYSFMIGFRVASVSKHQGGTDGAMIALIIFVSYMGQSLTSNVLNERYMAIILAVVAGSMLIYADEILDARRSHGQLKLRNTRAVSAAIGEVSR